MAFKLIGLRALKLLFQVHGIGKEKTSCVFNFAFQDLSARSFNLFDDGSHVPGLESPAGSFSGFLGHIGDVPESGKQGVPGGFVKGLPVPPVFRIFPIRFQGPKGISQEGIDLFPLGWQGQEGFRGDGFQSFYGKAPSGEAVVPEARLGLEAVFKPGSIKGKPLVGEYCSPA